MGSMNMKSAVIALLSLAYLIVGFGVSGCKPQDTTPSEAEAAKTAVSLAPYQDELLYIAFAAASAMPLQPHIKNRSRAQEVVVTAAFELQQPERARGYIDRIANWRRGAGYADLAMCYARMGDETEVEPCLELAAEVAAQAEDWRKDRIKAKIAATRAYMGQAQVRAEQGVAADEWGPVTRAEAMACSPEAVDQKMAALETLAATQDFDVANGALGAYAELYRRFYDDPKRRNRAEKGIKSAWDKLPVFVRIDLLVELADASLDHDDCAKALELTDEAKTLMDSSRWQAQAAISLKARLAQRRFLARDSATAVAWAKQALGLFESNRQSIVNIYRAGMLRPIAEAFVVMGDEAMAMDLYKRAVEAGMENPNSRPRADDLVATCCSMAVHGFEPDSTLMARIQDIQAGLGDPW